MTIFFGLELDDRIIRPQQIAQNGTHYFGLKKLLAFLESRTGLVPILPENDYLRAEQYRQILSSFLENKDPQAPFFKSSFQADQLSTAQALLELRDELKLNNFTFESNNNTPDRIRCFCKLEQIAKEKLDPGFADRWINSTKQFKNCDLNFTQLIHVEALELLPVFLKNWFKEIAQRGIEVKQYGDIEAVFPLDKDLNLFKNSLSKTTNSKEQLLQKDGSLILLASKRETELARFIAQIKDLNPDFHPSCIIPDKNRALDNAFIQEALPSLGILSASLGRPTLQILKLVTAFLWNPIDPIKIMEFVSLAVKPIDDGLATVIARELARIPGIGGDNWSRAIAIYFDKVREDSKTDKSLDINKISFDYDFWFKRKRYSISAKVPKEEVVQIFERVRNWSLRLFEESNNKNNSILILSEQAKRMLDLLEAIPESDLTYLELERIVRAIYEPAPVQFKEEEQGHLDFVYHNTALLDKPEQLLWWNFSEKEPDYFFSKWYQEEIKYLQGEGVQLFLPKDRNKLITWQRSQPIFQSKHQLILCFSEFVNGEKVLPHPLMGNLKANFKNLEDITVNIDNKNNLDWLSNFLNLPKKENLEVLSGSRQDAFISIEQKDVLSIREKESYSSLDDLFYYPYKWVFKHQLALYKSSILSVVNEKTLLGNLAHRFFELLLKEDIQQMDKAAVFDWIDAHKQNIFTEEGAPLLMYGKEPQRINFVNRLKYAAINLIRHICDNGWQVVGTEVLLEGKFMGIPIKGIADLVLEKQGEKAVIDLKWSGRRRRTSLIKSEEDLQLTLYAKLIEPHHEWTHTAYFILDEGVMITRNNTAFRNAFEVSPEQDTKESYQRIWAKMQATFDWRMQQLKAGRIEVRTKESKDELEEIYGEELLKVLEMKSEDAFFDDYKSLVNRFD